MPDQLYQYCVGYLSQEAAGDEQVIVDCSRIYLVDGQPIGFSDTLRQSTALDRLSDEQMLGRNNAKGQDSIHFQQLRAYDLATRIIRHRHELAPGRTLRVAVVGAGFSGVTAVLTLLNDPDIDVNVALFEHHRHIMPRFAGAFGRRVYPYHHLRVPSQVMIASAGDVLWCCPAKGTDQMEFGGIDKVLSWAPGPIEKVAKQVKDFAEEEFLKHTGEGRLEVRLQTKVKGVYPADGNVSIIDWVDYEDINDDNTVTSMEEMDDESSERETFDVVILAPGSGRDAVSLLGQSNAEYWTPSRLVNAEPAAGRHEVAVIGSGNSAASEVFNYLLPEHGFANFLDALQKWQEDEELGPSVKKLLNIAYDGEMTEVGFGELLTKQAWDQLAAAFKSKLVKNRVLNSSRLVGVTVFVRTNDPLFSTMNGINKFLVLLLARLGYVEIRNVYDEYGITAPSAADTYLISIRERIPVMKLPNGEELLPKGSTHWTQICNCSGVDRTYQNVFAGTTQSGEPHVMLYQVVGGGERKWSLRELLVAKQAVLQRASKAAEAIKAEVVTAQER
ncbi:FAD/NAD(P)-binding protein [Devosia sediminis]|uniref:FAD-dependent urate hydroxylase HpyO/Asp monooxygenase CreE-like FAD/NAD(P)-binding domain-containing protein n=1 Tax=Devosia sediminis TaxID=2798801 RepID=A0A934IXV3_9HYPH|nr:FAD/NAD(P)-binding protein [Devosia sediminis]MBJ3786397.1 hypothetical protein [Devosia sediminis]